MARRASVCRDRNGRRARQDGGVPLPVRLSDLEGRVERLTATHPLPAAPEKPGAVRSPLSARGPAVRFTGRSARLSESAPARRRSRPGQGRSPAIGARPRRPPVPRPPRTGRTRAGHGLYGGAAVGDRGDGPGAARHPGGAVGRAEVARGALDPRCQRPWCVKKFSKNRRPCRVVMLSGWNCTPCTGSSRCRRPMTYPSSSDVAVSRSAFGNGRDTTSEW